MVITAIPAGLLRFIRYWEVNHCTNPILYFWCSWYQAGIFNALSSGNFIWNNHSNINCFSLNSHQHNAVDFSVVKGYGVFVIIGVILGTILAAGLKTKPLILFFNCCLYSCFLFIILKGVRYK